LARRLGKKRMSAQAHARCLPLLEDPWLGILGVESLKSVNLQRESQENQLAKVDKRLNVKCAKLNATINAPDRNLRVLLGVTSIPSRLEK